MKNNSKFKIVIALVTLVIVIVIIIITVMLLNNKKNDTNGTTNNIDYNVEYNLNARDEQIVDNNRISDENDTEPEEEELTEANEA